MEDSEVFYERNFSDFGALQAAHTVRYILTRDANEIYPYGVAVMRISNSEQTGAERRGICETEHCAKILLGFLWENSVEPESVPGIIDDLKASCMI